VRPRFSWLVWLVLPSCAASAPRPSSSAATRPVVPSPERIAAAMPGVGPSAFAAELTAHGVDPANLPPLAALDKATLKAIMPSLSKAVGMGCSECHVQHDYPAPTEMKRIAAGMWEHFAQKLTLAGGAPLYCDSCHHGQRKLLSRADLPALNFAMDQAYAQGIHRKDGAENDCSTCHGKHFEPHIEDKLWRGQP